MDSGEYWNKKIIEWEDSQKKGPKKLSFIEKIASKFRKPLKRRASMCMKILLPHVKGKSVLELGCGSGYFAFELLEKGSPKKVIGVDIAKNAINRANDLAKSRNLSKQLKFLKADANEFTLLNTDYTIGLGFLDYLNPREIRTLFDSMKSKHFVFTFSEKKFSLLRYFHIVYLLSQNCPKHFYYTKKQIRKMIGSKHEGVKFYSHPKLSFGVIVHNLPKKE